MKNCNKLFLFIVVMGIALTVAPVFAQQPKEFVGVWLREGKAEGGNFQNENEKVYIYFTTATSDASSEIAEGFVKGTVVGLSVADDVLGTSQVLPFTGNAYFGKVKGTALFIVQGKMYVGGMFIGNQVLIDPGVYRFYTEGGKQKMEYQFRNPKGTISEKKEIWTKIGTKLSDLPQLGPVRGNFWARNGIVVD